MELSITDSVGRQLEEKRKQLRAIKDVKSTTKNKRTVEVITNVEIKQRSKISGIAFAHKKLQQGLMYTNEGWVKRR